MMHTYACGCVTCGEATAYCREHSEANPPGKPPPEKKRDDRTSIYGRKRWNPDTGELEESNG